MQQAVWTIVAAIVLLNVAGFLGAVLFVRLHRSWRRRRG
jgi:hypothetical protein